MRLVHAGYEDASRAVAFCDTHYPFVNFAGIGPGYQGWSNRRATLEADHRELKAELDTERALRQLTTCLAWLGHCQFVKAPTIGSYSLKHVIEQWGGSNGLEPYVTNGCAIVAALYRGVPMKLRDHASPNCDFGISRKSMKALDPRYIAEQAERARSRQSAADWREIRRLTRGMTLQEERLLWESVDMEVRGMVNDADPS